MSRLAVTTFNKLLMPPKFLSVLNSGAVTGVSCSTWHIPFSILVACPVGIYQFLLHDRLAGSKSRTIMVPCACNLHPEGDVR